VERWALLNKSMFETIYQDLVNATDQHSAIVANNTH